MIHEYLDGAVSVRYGPHVVGRYDSEGRPMQDPKGRGKAGTTAPTAAVPLLRKRKPRSRKPEGLTRLSYETGQITCE